MAAATDVSGMTVEVQVTLRVDGSEPRLRKGDMRQPSVWPFSRSASQPPN